LLALVLAAAHEIALIPFPKTWFDRSLTQGLALTVPWAFPLLLLMPESGIRTLWGWIRLAALILLLGGTATWAAAKAIPFPLPAWPGGLPGGVGVISSVLALLAMWVLPGREGAGLRPAWSLALMAVGLAFTGSEPWWPTPLRGSVWPVFVTLAAVFVLAGMYGITWRRAYLDELTGLPGRRAFDEALRRVGRHYAIAMVDVDHFKRFNDRYGHPVGDQVLRFIASRLKTISFGRSFRYGGEEFAIVMPGRSLDAALPHLEALRAVIEASTLVLRAKDRPLVKPRKRSRSAGGRARVGVTVSIGAAHRSRLHPSPHDVVAAADEALYRAKRKGRNRVEAERRKVKR
jgi:diguanylate cyclase (GGDEF)-like protein